MLPFFKRVAVWPVLATLIDPVATKDPRFGSNSSALDNVMIPATFIVVIPPAKRTSGGSLERALLPALARPDANASATATNTIARAPN
jgi:hypothetical protein